MLLAMGARPQLVGVSSYDEEAEVKGLPRVGALLDPDVERIISLTPDLVLVYGSQQDLITQLSRGSIPTFSYRHGGLAHVMTTIRELGARVGRVAPANRLADTLEARIAAVKGKVASARRPRTLLVFGREAGTLRAIYVSGGRGFLHDMLEAAGGENVYRDVQTEAVQASSEMILSRAPEVIIELRSLAVPSAAERRREMDAWRALSSVPAVRTSRLYLLAGKSLNVPGPLVADGVEQMARVLHGERFK
jgi:iron complex transport system substrate-binding protein